MAKGHHRRIPLAEWIAGLLGGLIVLGTIGFLAFETVRPGVQDPVLTVAVLQIRDATGAFVVDVEVRNHSRGTAADVHLTGAATMPGGGEIHAQARVDYVAGFSTRRASLVFEADPRRALTVRVAGYARP